MARKYNAVAIKTLALELSYLDQLWAETDPAGWRALKSADPELVNALIEGVARI